MLAPLGEVVAEGEVDIEGDDDVEPLKKAKNPRLPSREEVEEHIRTHIPFRSWCKWCVEGRGRGDQHRSSQGFTAGGVMNRQSLDYGTDAAGEAALTAARRQGVVVKCLVIRCNSTK